MLGDGKVQKQYRLFTWLRQNGYLLRNDRGDNIPYQRHIDAGFFRTKMYTYPTGGGEKGISHVTLITGRGIAYIWKKMKEKGEKCVDALPQTALF